MQLDKKANRQLRPAMGLKIVSGYMCDTYLYQKMLGFKWTEQAKPTTRKGLWAYQSPEHEPHAK